MGGNEEVNSVTKTGAEFNFECDPEAAQQVISKVCLRQSVQLYRS